MSDDLTKRLAIESMPSLDQFGDTVDEDWVRETFALAAARIAELERQIAEARDKALEEAAAHLHWLWNADGSKTERRVMTDSIKAIRNLKDTP